MKSTAIAVCALLFANAAGACSVSDIRITSMRAGFVDECRSSPCFSLKGIATLQNNCREAAGIQLQIIGFNKAGEPVLTTEFWPASIRNIPSGSYTFSLDHVLDYQPGVTSFTLTPVSVKTWR